MAETTIEIVIRGGNNGDEDGAAIMPATVIGPLAVHRMFPVTGYPDLDDGRNLWTITHIETGFAVMHNLTTKKLALKIARRLSERDVWDGLSRSAVTDKNVRASEWARDVLNEFRKAEAGE